MSITQFQLASQKVAALFAANIQKGQLSFPDTIKDVCLYYKLPAALLHNGYWTECYQVLDYIKSNFMLENGDFGISKDKKTAHAVLNKFGCYINGWIVMSAHQVGRFDISYPGYVYLSSFIHPTLGGSCVSAPYGKGNGEIDVLVSSHVGLACLHFNDLDKAKKSGDCLKKFLELQPNQTQAMYLRRAGDGTLITEYPVDQEPFYVVKAQEPNQLYFMIGYPIAFLAKLYQATGDKSYLNAAEVILDFGLRCHDSKYSVHFAHKLAWGAACVANLTQNEKYVSLAKKIGAFFCTLQNNAGLFLEDADPMDKYDQSAELGVWLQEYHALLK